MPAWLCHLLKPEQRKCIWGQIHVAHRLPVLQTPAKGIKTSGPSFLFLLLLEVKRLPNMPIGIPIGCGRTLILVPAAQQG